MFEAKQKCLFGNSPVKSVEITQSGNGSVKLTSTGDPFVDQFAFISQYRNPRDFKDIAEDMKTLWGINPLITMKLTFYIRSVTRKVELFDGTETKSVQKGQGLKHEGIMRMIWVAVNYPEVFYNNLPLFVSAGGWKDIIQMMSYDLQYHGWKGRVLDWKKLGDFILAGLENPNTSELVKKYLPTIKAKSKIKTLEAQADTIIGKYIAHRLFGKGQFKVDQYHSLNYKQYRQLKVSGTAHQWQQLISQHKLLNINFSTIHGRALSLLVSGNFLKNNGLEDAYEKWIEKQPVAKFTGYVYELFKNIYQNQDKKYKLTTIDKQFEGLIETAKTSVKSTFLVVRDTSGSMSSKAIGVNATSNEIAKAFALYFSYLLEGPFSNCYAEFDSYTRMKSWKGSTPSEKYINDRSAAYGGTNFLGVADLLIKSFKEGTPISQFPTGILCISDGEFDNSGISNRTTFSQFIKKLKDAGFSKEYCENFKIVLWDIPNEFYFSWRSAQPRPKFESFADTPNFFYMSGLDPAGIAFLLGKELGDNTPKTPKELFLAAMNQELLNLIVI